MDNEHAKEILETLLEQMEENGYGEITQLARVRLEERYTSGNSEFEQSFKVQLRLYLQEIIGILDAISSKNLPRTISTINEFTQSSIDIENIYVELLDGQEFNLKQLPDYTPVTEMLRDVQRQLDNE